MRATLLTVSKWLSVSLLSDEIIGVKPAQGRESQSKDCLDSLQSFSEHIEEEVWSQSNCWEYRV